MGYQNTAGATGDLNGDKIADGITKFSKNSQKNNSETIKNENYKKNISRKICVSRNREGNY